MCSKFFFMQAHSQKSAMGGGGGRCGGLGADPPTTGGKNPATGGVGADTPALEFFFGKITILGLF